MLILVPTHPTSSHSYGLDSASAEDSSPRPKEVSTPPGRGRGHPAQDHADLPQGLLPRRYGWGKRNSERSPGAYAAMYNSSVDSGLWGGLLYKGEGLLLQHRPEAQPEVQWRIQPFCQDCRQSKAELVGLWPSPRSSTLSFRRSFLYQRETSSSTSSGTWRTGSRRPGLPEMVWRCSTWLFGHSFNGVSLLLRVYSSVHLSSVLHEEALDQHSAWQGQERGHDLPLPSGATKAAQRWGLGNFLFVTGCSYPFAPSSRLPQVHQGRGMDVRSAYLQGQVRRVQGWAAVDPSNAEGAHSDGPYQGHERSGVEERNRQVLQSGKQPRVITSHPGYF